jgi:hypothetical protein
MSILFATLLASTPDAVAGPVADRISAAPEVVWLGLDYSRVRIFTPETFADPEERVFWDPGGGLGDVVTHFKKPKEAWDELIVDWNTMAVNTVIDGLEKAIQKEITVDLATPSGQTSRKGDTFFESVYDAKNVQPELTPEIVQDMVKKYRVKERKGVGFVMVMDRLSFPEKQACVWPVFYDLADKTVISSQRVCKKPGGRGYRNYWFNIVSSVAKDLEKGLKNREI